MFLDPRDISCGTALHPAGCRVEHACSSSSHRLRAAGVSGVSGVSGSPPQTQARPPLPEFRAAARLTAPLASASPVSTPAPCPSCSPRS